MTAAAILWIDGDAAHALQVRQLIAEHQPDWALVHSPTLDAGASAFTSHPWDAVVLCLEPDVQHLPALLELCASSSTFCCSGGCSFVRESAGHGGPPAQLRAASRSGSLGHMSVPAPSSSTVPLRTAQKSLHENRWMHPLPCKSVSIHRQNYDFNEPIASDSGGTGSL